MVNTWKDVWLESGLRILYLLPQEETKHLLPIDVQPSPNNMERVMVWQTELITSSDRRKARRILLQDPSEVTVKQVRNQLREEFGRFWIVIVKNVKQNITSEEQLDHIRNNLGEDE